MTHTSTEQERAEFEAWWQQEMNIEQMDLARTEYPMTPPEKQMYKCHDTERAWLTWQAARRAEFGTNSKAEFVIEVRNLKRRIRELETELQAARRAPVVPVQYVPVTASMGTTQRAREDGWNACVDALLAAAPQPPEATVKDWLTVDAAPVKLPNVDTVGVMLELESRIQFVESQTTRRAMEAAVQLLKILAAHGIK